MSVLSVVCEPDAVEFRVQPDPNAPPRLLADVLAVGALPELVEVGGARRPTAALLRSWLFGKLQPAGQAAIVETLIAWLEAIDAHPDSEVVLMGQVDQIVFAAPSTASSEAIDAFLASIDLPGRHVHVVDERIALLASAAGSHDPGTRFTWCRWDDDLELRTGFGYPTMRHVGSIGETRRRADLGIAALRAALLPMLVDRTKLAGDALTRATFLVGEAVARHGGSDDLRVTVDDAIEVALSASEVDAITSPVLVPAGHYLRYALERLPDAVELVLIGGECARLPRFSAVARAACHDRGYRTSEPGHSVADGLHICIVPAPQLAYDCGFILRRADTPQGIGTLVLVRPTAIGQSRQSEDVELRAVDGEPLEVAFYLRRLELSTAGTAITSEVFDNHPFVAQLRDGRARIRVRMQVDADPGSAAAVLVTIAVTDVHGGNTVTYEGLRVRDGQPMTRPPFRHEEELAGAAWGTRLREIHDAISDDKTYEVVAWFNTCKGQSSGGGGSNKVPRATYAAAILALVREAHSQLQDDRFVATATPDDFQRAAREELFVEMHAMAVEHANNGTWARHYPRSKPAPTDGQCADAFLNALSPAVANAANHQQLAEHIKRLRQHYRHACSKPTDLNIDW